jgi:hypothetical protein
MSGFLPYVLLVMLPSIAITGWAAFRVRSTYARWAAIDSGINLSAFDFARRLLDAQGLTDVGVEPIAGQLTDQYDPRVKVMRISNGVADPRLLGTATAPRLSVASAAVIAHEVGHALQDRQRDPWMRARQSIVPVVQLGSGLAPWLILGGLWTRMMGLATVGLVAFGAAVVFTFLTLPVEIGASGKALAFVSSLGLSGERQAGARDVLKAAAWTYVAAALSALLTFLYYLMLIMGRRD